MLVNASAILLQFPEYRDQTMEIQAASRDAIQGANLFDAYDSSSTRCGKISQWGTETETRYRGAGQSSGVECSTRR